MLKNYLIVILLICSSMKFNKIIESKKVVNYIRNHNLLNQYKKAKDNILNNYNTKVFFKEKLPKWSWIFYFRINKKYRALWFIKDDELRIYDIDNHQ